MPNSSPGTWTCRLLYLPTIQYVSQCQRSHQPETGAQASEASSMWLLSSYSDTIPNVKFVSTICDLTENPAEGRQQTCKANLRYYLHAEENLYQWIQV